VVTPKVSAEAFDEAEIASSVPTPPSGTAVSTTQHEANAPVSLAYIWSKAPSLSEILATASNAARAFRAEEKGMIAASIASRKRNEKAEYLRGFVYLLRDHGWKMTDSVVKAIALAAEVAMDTNSVSLRDVRRALSYVEPPSEVSN
jgi:hypothetical protein